MPVIAVIAVIAGTVLGSVNVSASDVVSIIGNKIFGINLPDNVSDSSVSIIWQLRLPRVILAFLVGAALSCSGAVVQSVLRNPLASPYTLGVSSGASLGVAIIILTNISLFHSSGLNMSFFGLVFGIGTVILSVNFALLVDRNLSSTTIVLCGMVLSLFLNAILTLISAFYSNKLQQIILWQMGSFSSKGWDYVIILFPVLVAGIILFTLFSRELDILTFGDEQASSVGVETKKVKWLLLIVSAVLTGCAVAFAGVIGFIDLIAPHVVRKLFSSRHKYVIILSALFGGIFMVGADLISRTLVSPRELPVGAVTAIVGSPFFAYVYLKRRKR